MYAQDHSNGVSLWRWLCSLMGTLLNDNEMVAEITANSIRDYFFATAGRTLYKSDVPA